MGYKSGDCFIGKYYIIRLEYQLIPDFWQVTAFPGNKRQIGYSELYYFKPCSPELFEKAKKLYDMAEAGVKSIINQNNE